MIRWPGFVAIDPQGICDRCLHLDVAGTPVKLASIDDLIALKTRAGRPIDLSDIDHLKRLPPQP